MHSEIIEKIPGTLKILLALGFRHCIIVNGIAWLNRREKELALNYRNQMRVSCLRHDLHHHTLWKSD